jgi:hypothetical protein
LRQLVDESTRFERTQWRQDNVECDYRSDGGSIEGVEGAGDKAEYRRWWAYQCAVVRQARPEFAVVQMRRLLEGQHTVVRLYRVRC